MNALETAEWFRIRTYIEQRIEAVRAELEDHKAGHDQTQFTRGRLAELRDLLILNKPTDSAGPQARVHQPVP